MFLPLFVIVVFLSSLTPQPCSCDPPLGSLLGIGSFCQDATQGDPAFPDAENYAIFNQFCSSG